MTLHEAGLEAALLPCPLCDMYLRKAVDPRLSGMLEHPANLHCPISALAFADTASNRAAWNRRASLPAPQGPVGIKALEWHGDTAQSLVGIYRLETFDTGVIWGLNGIRQNHLKPSENATEARAAVQADFEARIRSTFAAPQPPSPDTGAEP